MPGAIGQNLVHLQKVVFLCLSFLEVHILTTTFQKAFILGQNVHCRDSFDSMTLDPGSMLGLRLEVKI